MTLSLLSPSLPVQKCASPTSPSVSRPVDVVRGVLMPLRAMGFSGFVVSPVPNRVKPVRATGVPAKVLQPVVERVRVRKVARLLTRSRRANEGHQDKTMNLVFSSGFSRKGDMRSPVDNNGCKGFPFEPLDLPIDSHHNPVQGPNIPLVGDFVHSLVSRDWEPLFNSHEGNNTSPDTIGAHNRERNPL